MGCLPVGLQDRRSSTGTGTATGLVQLTKIKLLEWLAVDLEINEEPAELMNFKGDNTHFLMKFKVTPRGRPQILGLPVLGE